MAWAKKRPAEETLEEQNAAKSRFRFGAPKPDSPWARLRLPGAAPPVTAPVTAPKAAIPFPAAATSTWGSLTLGKTRTQVSKVQRVFIETPSVADPDLELARSVLEVSVEGAAGANCAPVVSFEELNVLPAYVMQALVDMNCVAPMPIQAQALPIILGGHDLIGIARTGSGKTLAFLLPMVVHIEAQEPLQGFVASPVGLVLAPTRELAAQIAEQAGKLLENSSKGNHKKGLRAQEVYGGKKRQDQLQKARGCAIVVATPGRLTDFVESGDLSLARVTYFVLDEADRMLDLGFQGDVQNFSSHIRPDRHMLFFSATWPKAVEDLAASLCKNNKPVKLKVGQRDDGAQATRADIIQEVQVFDQESWDERDKAKQAVLYPHVREVLKEESNKVLVFVSSKILADELATQLFNEGFTTESMHGGRQQGARDLALYRFKQGEIRLLVATDVMGRGLDIPTISHVVIYDMGDIDDYVHRIGRTARGINEKPGHALTLFEYNQKWPELAGGLAKVLLDSQQPVPDELYRIALEVEGGLRRVVDRTMVKNNPGSKARNKHWGGENWQTDQSWGGSSAW